MLVILVLPHPPAILPVVPIVNTDNEKEGKYCQASVLTVDFFIIFKTSNSNEEL